MAKQRTVFVCSECGNETPNWAGKCPSCGAWNTLKEIAVDSKIKNKNARVSVSESSSSEPQRLSDISSTQDVRFSTGIDELNRVLGGGAVVGSLILIGGAPGIGKSTILLQLCGEIGSSKKVLYISGEESEHQLKMRAKRIGVENGEIFVLAETNMERILRSIDEINPDIVIVDSIQTVYLDHVESTPGSISQVRECTMALMRKTKANTFTTFIVGHVNKDGNIAGPKILEHMVDCVLYFEGEQNTTFRILRSAKNRYGSTNEIGVFEMNDRGLQCVDNPSEVLISGRPSNSPGTCVVGVMEGSRPILAEIQALVTPSGYNAAIRRANGIDYNRVTMLLAVLEKRGGLQVTSCDTYVNVVGGLFLDEPAADLATILAIASSYKDQPLGDHFAALGEIGLSGEIRSIQNVNQRIAEIARLGFKECLIPYNSKLDLPEDKTNNIDIIRVKNIREALKVCFK